MMKKFFNDPECRIISVSTSRRIAQVSPYTMEQVERVQINNEEDW